MQPFLRDDGVQFVHVCRTDPFGIGKVCNLFIGRSVVTAAILSRTYRIVIVIQGDGLADSGLEFLFRLRHILRHTIPHGIGFRFQEMDFG